MGVQDCKPAVSVSSEVFEILECLGQIFFIS